MPTPDECKKEDKVFVKEHESASGKKIPAQCRKKPAASADHRRKA